MAYTLVPVTGQSLGQTRDAIRTNFVELQDTIDLNHFDMDATNAGRHVYVELPVFSGVPTTADLIAGEATLYSNTAGQSQLFFTPDVGGKGYQLTRGIDANYASFATNNALTGATAGVGGWTFLPGGLLLQYGLVTGAVKPSGTVTFPISFTNPPFSITLTGVRNSTDIDALYVQTTPLAGSFIYENTSSSISNFYFVAIGI